MDLDYRLTSQFSADTSGEYTETPLDFIQDVDGVFRASFLWDIGALNIIPGDIVEYFAVVADNDNINGPKIAQSKIYTLRLLSMEEMYQAMEQSENEGFEQLEKALENSREMKEEIEHAINEMRRKGDLDWTQKRDLQEKAKFNEETIKKLEEAKSKLEEVMSQAEESSLMSLELLQKYSELQKLISEIATPEMLKAFQQLNDALQQADPEKLRQAMEMFQMSQEEMLKKIEKSLEILKQLQLERKLEELAQRAAEMAQRQDDINQKIPDEEQVESPELARKEASLEKDLDEWEQKLEESEKLAAERDSSTANELSQIQEQAQSLPQEMEQMSSMMKSGQNEASRSKGGRISQKLTQISQELSRIKEEMISRKKAELSEKMLSAVRDLVTISQQQEELKSASSNLSTRSPQFRDQASLQAGIAEGLEKVTNKLFELSQQTFFVTPEIGKSLGQASAIMQTALSNYTERNPRGVTPQQMKAMESINQAAVQVLDAISQMQGSASSTGFSELMEKLQQMAGQQASLNQDTQSLMMPMPGEGGMSMEQMAAMGRLAAQQRALQKAMQEAAEQAQQLGKVLGDLGQAAQNMGEVADSLEDRNVGERTLKLQERILSRLLDAQKSVRTQKVSRERQSRTGEDMSRRSPGEIPLDQLEEQMRRDILRAMKEGYSPDYQKLIQDYFRTIYQRKKND
jgi:hypothetical protein